MKVNYISALPLCREKLNKLMPRFILPLSSQRENNCRVNKHCLDWWLMDQFGSLIFTCRWWIHTDEAAGSQKRVLTKSPGSPPALPQPNRWLPELQASSTLMCDYCVWRSEDLLVDSVILETNMGFCLRFTDWVLSWGRWLPTCKWDEGTSVWTHQLPVLMYGLFWSHTRWNMHNFSPKRPPIIVFYWI